MDAHEMMRRMEHCADAANRAVCAFTGARAHVTPIDNGRFLLLAVWVVAGLFAGFIAWSVSNGIFARMLKGNRLMGHGLGLLFGAWVAIFTFHMVVNTIDQGLPFLDSESVAIASAQTSLTIGNLFRTDHTPLVPAGDTGAPVEDQPYEPKIIHGAPLTDHWQLPEAVRSKQNRLLP